jgi:hypothetical protein
MVIPTSHVGYEKCSGFEAVRAEALFASTIQSSDRPTDVEVRGAVAATLRKLGIRGCAAAVAVEYGEHPETACARMLWALATVRASYPMYVSELALAG